MPWLVHCNTQAGLDSGNGTLDIASVSLMHKQYNFKMWSQAVYGYVSSLELLQQQCEKIFMQTTKWAHCVRIGVLVHS